MKVAFCIRPEYNNPIGGDAIQMLKTKEYLEKNYNIHIDVITTPEKITNKYDIIHVFNFSTYKISRKFIQKANELKIPVVSSPIYWDYSFASTVSLFHFLPYPKHLNEITINVLKSITKLLGFILSKPEIVSSNFKRNAKWMFGQSTKIAPNSDEEAKLLLRWIGTDDSDKIRIVYNASDNVKTDSTDKKEDFLFKKYNIPKNYILQVGRIEYCKNQLNLISSLKNNPEIPIVFVGKYVEQKYYTKIKKLAAERGNVFFIESVPHDEINIIYKYARLHVLLSLRESPGLVNIEALSNGCPIVISDKRFLPVETYFSNQPYIVNPLNIGNVKEVVLEAYNSRKIVPFDFDKFSWETVSKQTYNIYNEIQNCDKNRLPTIL